MKQLQIANTNQTGLIGHLIERYEAWKDFENFFQGKNDPYLFSANSNGIPSFRWNEIDNINNSKSTVIAIDSMCEGLNIKETLNAYDPSKHYLIFSTAWWDTNQVKLDIKYTLMHHHYWLFDIHDRFFSPYRFNFLEEKLYNFDYPKPLNCVAFFGTRRLPRDYLIKKIQQTLDLKKSIVRYERHDLGVPADSFDLAPISSKEFDPYNHAYQKYFFSLGLAMPQKLYDQGYFNLVVETTMDIDNHFFLTEKTIKALITGVPFVVAADALFLKRLHQLGFTTYNTLWNEDYDAILDCNERLTCVAELCKNLETFDWIKHKSELELIAFKNRSNFLCLNSLIKKEFETLDQQIQQLEI